MTMEQFVRKNAEMDLAATFGAVRAHRMMEGAEVHAMPRVAVPEVEDRLLVEWRETEDSPLSWVVLASA